MLVAIGNSAPSAAHGGQERNFMTYDVEKMAEELKNKYSHSYEDVECVKHSHTDWVGLATHVLRLIKKAEIEAKMNELEVIHEKLSGVSGFFEVDEEFSFVKEQRLAALRTEQEKLDEK